MIDDGCKTEGCELKTFDDYWAYSEYTLKDRAEAHQPDIGKTFNNIRSSVLSSGNPVTNAANFSFAAYEVLSGGLNEKQSLVDLLYQAGSNLSTGLMGLAMGGDTDSGGLNLSGDLEYNRGAFGSLDPDVKAAVLDRDNYTCSYCGTRGGDLTVDHVESMKQIWNEGASSWSDKERNDWSNNMSNLVTACRSCNASKGSSPLVLYLLRLFNK
jgi:hypothetical protein